MDSQRLVVFKSSDGKTSIPMDMPLGITVPTMTQLINKLLDKSDEESVPYRFFVNDNEILDSIQSTLSQKELSNAEVTLIITYIEEAPFRVRPITRCTSSLQGHAEAVISAQFSPDSRILATGSGDTTVRFWDLDTQTPYKAITGHKHWVLCIAWAPDGRRLASADKNGLIAVWTAEGKQVGKFLSGHRQWVTGLAWEPYHIDASCRRLASSGKDGDIRIWDTLTFVCLRILSSHTSAVTCVRWGGVGLVYSASQDRTIKVWRADDGVLCRTLTGHGHWVNSLSTCGDWLIKNGPFYPLERGSESALGLAAGERYKKILKNEERIVSGSDDFQLMLWNPESSNKAVATMTGHQQTINDVKFSPDGCIIASASFDKSIRLWDGITGKFLKKLLGHVSRVYVLAWAADSRLLASGSADSTLKVWNVKVGKLEVELPGHSDEVFALDWSGDGLIVGSGGKDKVVRLWRS